MTIKGDVGKNFPFDDRFANVLLDLIDGIVTALDAAVADPDLEPEEDCCGAAEDLGSLSVLLPWCPCGVSADRDDDEPDADAEPDNDDETTPSPGFMHRNGLWCGKPILFHPKECV